MWKSGLPSPLRTQSFHLSMLIQTLYRPLLPCPSTSAPACTLSWRWLQPSSPLSRLAAEVHRWCMFGSIGEYTSLYSTRSSRPMPDRVGRSYAQADRVAMITPVMTNTILENGCVRVHEPQDINCCDSTSALLAYLPPFALRDAAIGYGSEVAIERKSD